MKDKDTIRAEVARAYTSVLDGSADSAVQQSKSAIARLANYSGEALADIPLDAVQNSFGCGNPLAFAAVKPGDVVLDLGSGAGMDLLLAAGMVGEAGHVIGIDMTEAMLDRARANIRAAGAQNVEVRRGLIEDLPVEDASVDWVISNCVVNLSPDKRQVFTEIFRVLKPGGQMLVSDIVVAADALPDWLARSPQLYNACLAGAIDEVDYTQGLRDAGLADVQVLSRLYYDASALGGLARGGELPDIKEFLDSLSADEAEQLIRQVTEALAGKVCSAKIYARKPCS